MTQRGDEAEAAGERKSKQRNAAREEKKGRERKNEREEKK